MGNKITLENVCKNIKGKQILKNINLDLEAGGIYGFFGHNGSGKSVLFKIISGLVVPTSGKVQVFGQDLFKEGREFPRSMGITVDNVGLWPDYSARENLEMLASIKKTASREDVKNAIQRVGLDYEDKKVYKKFSLGMKQRLGIAQAIMEKPDLIILDEPTNALDESGVEEIRKVLLEENERKATILLCSHNKEDLQQLCSKAFKLSDGEIVDEVVINRGGQGAGSDEKSL